MKRFIAALALGLAATGAALAQAWPTARPVTLLVSFPPGGSTDMIARTLGPKLQDKLGGTFIVDNKPGAGGTLAAGLAKRAAPDGYTLFVSSLGPFVIGPHLIKGLAYDPLKDFDYITVAVQAPNVLAVSAASRYKTLADLMADLKARPDAVTFASAGTGTSDHLTAELFWQETGTKAVHVPYKGGAPALQDLLGERVTSYFAAPPTALPHIEAGKLIPLATTGLKRPAYMPDIPTVAEAGYPGFEALNWYAFVAPGKTPKPLLDRWNTEIVKVLNDPGVKEALNKHGLTPQPTTRAEFAAFMKKEYEQWGKLIKERKLSVE